MVFTSNELDILVLQNGEDGVSADSKYIWVKYSKNSDGSGMTDDPTDAIYIGIAYNKTTIVESQDPTDYTWTLIKGDNGSDAYTIIIQNENITFSVDNDSNTVLTDQSFSSTIQVFKGTTERSDFTIGEVSSSNGITVSRQDKTIILSVKTGDRILADNGYFRIPISIDGLVFFKDITWNLSKQGEPGTSGEPALNIIVGNESQNIPCSNDGTVTENFLIEIPFMGYKGFDRIDCSVSVGLLPNGVTLASNTSSTSTTDGLIMLNVAKGASLGGTAVLSGKVGLTFTIDAKSMVRYFSWVKTKDGAEGSMTLYELQSSSPVITKNYDNTLSPSTITFNSCYRQSNSTTRDPYDGQFIIAESADGTTYTNKYVSSTNEDSITYTPSSDAILSIRCTLCKTDDISTELDVLTVPVLTNDNLKDTITEIKTSVSGVQSQVNNIDKSITDKVWQSDIDTSIDNYNNTTIKTISDKVSEHTMSIGEIKSSVSEVTSTLTEKADGSTVSELTEKVSQMEQDANGFKQTVEENYVSKSNLEDLYGEIGNVRSELTQTANSIETKVAASDGRITTLTEDLEGIKGRVSDAEGNITNITQMSNSLKTEIENARGDSATLSAKIDKIETSVSSVDGKASSAQQTADAITSTVQKDYAKLTDLEETKNQVQSSFEQRATSIESKVSLKQDTGLGSIRYIRDWLNGNSADTNNYWVNCKVLSRNENLSLGLIPIGYSDLETPIEVTVTNPTYYTEESTLDDITKYSSISEDGWSCLQLDLGDLKLVDYITVWHYYEGNRAYNHKLQISQDGNTWHTLYDSDIQGTYKESNDGKTYIINQGYVTESFSQINQNYEGIRALVSDNEKAIDSWDEITNELFSGIIQNTESLNEVENYKTETNNTLQELKGNYSSLKMDIDNINTTVQSFDGTYAKKTEVIQNDREWKIRLAKVGLYNGTDIEEQETNFTVSEYGAVLDNGKGQQIRMVANDTENGLFGSYNGKIIFQITEDLTTTERVLVRNGVDFTTIKYVPKSYNGIGCLLHVKSGGSS